MKIVNDHRIMIRKNNCFNHIWDMRDRQTDKSAAGEQIFSKRAAFTECNEFKNGNQLRKYI